MRAATASSSRSSSRAAGKPTWTATRFAADAYFATAGEGRALGIAADGSPTIVWAGDDDAVHAASPRAGGWAKRKVSGPDVYVVPSFDQGVALAVDEQGRAVAAWRGGPYLCDEPQFLEATVRGGSTVEWEATRRLATDEVATCEFSSNPAVVLLRNAALVAWREDVGPDAVMRLLWLSTGDTTPAAPVSLEAPESLAKPALVGNESGLVVAAWSDGRGVVATFNRVAP